MKTVTIVGAGFSGLSLAYQLRRRGIGVHVVDSQANPGGLIATRKTDYGLVETAANAVVADKDIEALFADLGVEFAVDLKSKKRRYVYWRGLSRWPLPLGPSLRLMKIPVLRAAGAESLRPLTDESAAAWARRVAGEDFEERLLSPALQGIYAGDTERMSAEFTVRALYEGGRRGASRAPKGGMEELIRAFVRWLETNGVKFEFEHSFRLESKPEDPVVLATSAWAACETLRACYPELSQTLAKCESLPLITVTAFFDRSESDREGFGCLFPRPQGFRSLGVIFNSSVFGGRSEEQLRSETWIFGGAHDRGAVDLSDNQIGEALSRDRRRLNGGAHAPRELVITRHARALPHYTLEWARELRRLEVPHPLYLHGNYLGDLGLASIYQRSKRLAGQIEETQSA